jgi:hypothetical protein
MQPFAAGTHNGMRIGKCIDGTVQQYPLLYPVREVVELVAPDTVCDKVPYRNFLIFERQINMSQIIHVFRCGIQLPNLQRSGEQ